MYKSKYLEKCKNREPAKEPEDQGKFLGTLIADDGATDIYDKTPNDIFADGFLMYRPENSATASSLCTGQSLSFTGHSLNSASIQRRPFRVTDE